MVGTVRSLRRRDLVVAIAACIGGTHFDYAAAQQAPQETPEGVEEVVVTGSFLSRPADRPQPLQVLDAEALAVEQKISISEVLRDLPITQGMAVFNAIVETGDSPTVSIDLRGLGPRATLTLLNGRRHTIDADAFTGGGVSAVDVNNLVPPIMVERIEILTDGASALYGSDAIAGVANFITRRNFEGVELSFQNQTVDRVGTDDYSFGALFGTQSEGTSIVAGLGIARRDPIITNDLHDTERLLSSEVSGFGNPPSLQPGGIPTRFPDPLCGDPSLGGSPIAGIEAGSSCNLLLSLGRVVVSATERANGMVTAMHDFDDGLSASMEIGFARARHERGTGHGFPIFFPLPVLPADNPGVIAANAADPDFVIQDYQIWHRVGSTIEEPIKDYQEQDTWRMVGSLDGEFGAWTWTASAGFSQNETQLKQEDTLRDRLDDALRCEGGPSGDMCYNPLANAFLASPGDPEWNDPAIKRWIQGVRIGDGQAKLRTLDFLVTRELGQMAGGSTGLAIGMQHRDEDFSFDWDSISNAGGFAWNNAPVLDFGGTRDSMGVFAELVMYPTQTLEVQLAARHEDYGSGVDSVDPKIGVLWTPTDRLFLRASAGTSFRVAGAVPAFGQTSVGSNMELHGQPIESRGLRRGNPNLAPEQGESLTAGVTWDVLDSFSMEFNYYNIQFTDLIRGEDGQELLLEDIADGTIDNPAFIIDPAAGTNVVADLEATDIIGFELSYINQDFQETEGLDFRFDWTGTSGPNEFNVWLQGVKTLAFDVVENGVLVDTVGSYNSTNFAPPIPEWQANLGFQWSRGGHFARATVRHIPKLEEDDVTRQGLTEEFAYTTIDLIYRYTFETNGLSLSLGVLNATDKEDPIDHGGLATTFSQLYDPRGRIFSFGLNKSFQ